MKTVSVKVASAVIAGLGLTAGVVGAVGAQTGSIGETGEDSVNEVIVNRDETVDTTKSADVTAENNNPQTAVTGDATVTDGDDDGTAESGEAGNDSALDGTVTVDQTGNNGGGSNNLNGSDVSGSIDGPTGEDSENYVEVNSNVERTNDSTANVNVVNNNSQYAQSGNATVDGGEDGGNATTGAALNTSTTSFNINVKQ